MVTQTQTQQKSFLSPSFCVSPTSANVQINITGSPTFTPVVESEVDMLCVSNKNSNSKTFKVCPRIQAEQFGKATKVKQTIVITNQKLAEPSKNQTGLCSFTFTFSGKLLMIEEHHQFVTEPTTFTRCIRKL